jgi:AraC-like DNA-binding protein
VNTSSFYFCKLFKKATGLNFTDYVSRVRIEKAKNLLLNPNLRISEIAFEVGFQSLTHFNRVFKKIIGQSPTQYRGQVDCA